MLLSKPRIFLQTTDCVIKRFIILQLIIFLPISTLQAQHDHAQHVPKYGTIEKCLTLKTNNEKVMCMQPLFAERLKTTPANVLIDEAATMQGNGEITDCHHIAHHLGKTLAKTRKTIDQAFKECSSSCVEGCFHGVMQAYIPSLPSDTRQIVNMLPKKCWAMSYALGEENHHRLYRQCIHGAGHGLTLKFSENFSSATDACLLLRDSWHNSRCLEGAFMEKMHSTSMMTVEELTNKINHFCNDDVTQENAQFETICMNNLGEAVAFASDHDLTISTSICKMLDEESAQSQCINAASNEHIWNKKASEEIKNRMSNND